MNYKHYHQTADHNIQVQQEELLANKRHAIIPNRSNQIILGADGKPKFFTGAELESRFMKLFGSTEKSHVLARCALIVEP